MSENQRQNGTVLFRAELSDEQYKSLRAHSRDAHYSFVEGILRGDDGFVYAWKAGRTYRDRTQAGCRVSFEVSDDPCFATGISWKLVDA